MSKWILINKKADFKALAGELNVDQVMARLMVNRGLTTVDEMREYLHPSLENIPNPHLFADMDLACDLLLEAIDEGMKIRVIGDYDVDGIMSTYILTSAIRIAGGDVDYAIPHRIEDGYGVNPEMVQKAHDEGVGFIITCDNGIAATPAIEKAIELGMTFVVTDHHEIPFDIVEGERVYKLPPAHAVVDPKREDCEYPFKGICGAQVAWKLTYVLFEFLGIEIEKADKFLEFAAIATVCDVMELKGENRATVYHGLKKIEQTENHGLRALLARNDLADKPLSCYHLGFVIGPCLNASGRLDTAKKALDLLNEADPAKALAMASELVELNSQRKSMTLAGIERAKEIMAEDNLYNDRVLVIYIPELHESLAGIVAGRIKEEFFKPTLVLTDAEVGVKGSGRSIEAYNMFEELSRVKELFTKFGGHPMAAGISLPTENVLALREELNENCTLSAEDMTEVVKIDIPMPLSYITVDLIEQMDLLEPFGTGNTKPLFALKDIEIIRASYIGRENQFLRLSLLDENHNPVTGLLFRGVEDFESTICTKYSKGAWEGLFSGRASGVKVDIVYQPSINEYKGNKSVQVIIEKFQ